MTDTNHESTQNASHSPGPWSCEYSPYNGGIPAYEVIDAEGNTVFDTNERTPAELQEANARLGAAAPKLLEALDYLLEQTIDQDLKYGIGLSEGEEDARVKALGAIAEAKGLAV